MLFVNDVICSSHWPLCLMPVMMVAGYKYNFITSLGKLMALEQVFIAISRIYITGFGLLDVFPIGTTKQK